MWFTNANVVDVISGTVTPDRAVEIADGRIASIASIAATAPEGAEVIDLAGRYLMPGLVSVHTHLSVLFPFSDIDPGENPGLTVLRAMSRATDALRAGVTTIRCVHEQNRADLLLREAAQAGWVDIPRIVGAGRAVSTTGGHGHGMACSYADGFDGFLHAARAELAAGADHIKIFITGGIASAGESFLGSQMTVEEMRGAVRAASEHHTYVVAHAGDGTAIEEALSAGVRSFEHAYSLDDRVAGLMKSEGAFLTPTLCVTRCPEWMADHHFTADQIQRALATGPGHLDSIKRAIEAGVTIVAGTDYPPGDPADDTIVAIREMEFLVEAGLDPLLALQAGTSRAAELLGLQEEIGRVEQGFVADLIVVDRDPTADLTALHDIGLVMHDGQVIRDDLQPVAPA